MKVKRAFTKTRLILAAVFVLSSVLALIFHSLFTFTIAKKIVLPSVLFLALLILAALLFKIEAGKRLRQAAEYACLLITPLATFIMVEAMQRSLFTLSAKAWVGNLALYFGLFLLLFLISRSVRISTYIFMPVLLLIGAINHYVIAFRGSPMQPWDIAAAKTAMNVAGNFIFSVDEIVLWTILLTTLYFILISGMRESIFKTLGAPVFYGSVSALILIFTFISCYMIIGNRARFDKNPWDQISSSKKNGYIVNFLINWQMMQNEAPDGYSEDKINEILAEYTTDDTATKKPNILVIMNEAYADLTKLDDIGLSEDYMPFTHSLKTDPNAITGDLVVSIFGGGTCNTEYEFLTSNVCPMLRTGSYPMQQFISSESVSLASNLKKLGYKTIGLHPYLGSGWNRNRAYPLLGFDQFITIEDFDENTEKIRDYVSDRACYKKAITLAEQNNEPTFIFAVTMQNHGGYEIPSDSVPDTISFNNQRLYPQTKQYMELAKISDQAIGELIEYYKKQERDTIILIFGDHQPSLGDEYTQLFKSTVTKKRLKALKKYEVPFIMWANFEIGSEKIKQTSPNYLAPLLMQKSGLPLTAYQKYLLDLRKDIPVISGISCISADGDAFDLGDEKYYDKLLDYRILQYNNVFDKKNLVADKFCYKE